MPFKDISSPVARLTVRSDHISNPNHFSVEKLDFAGSQRVRLQMALQPQYERSTRRTFEFFQTKSAKMIATLVALLSIFLTILDVL